MARRPAAAIRVRLISHEEVAARADVLHRSDALSAAAAACLVGEPGAGSAGERGVVEGLRRQLDALETARGAVQQH